MKNNPEATTLDDVLAELTARSAPPDAGALRDLMAKYPEFADELVNFATDWIEMELVPKADDATAGDEAEIVNRTMSRIQGVLDAEARPAVIVDLAQEIRLAGYEFAQFERVLGIDRSILDCLVKRAIKPFQIPASLVIGVAETLFRAIDQVRDYFRLPPVPATAFSARARPQVQQADFATIVEHSELTVQEKARWLSEPADQILKG